MLVVHQLIRLWLLWHLRVPCSCALALRSCCPPLTECLSLPAVQRPAVLQAETGIPSLPSGDKTPPCLCRVVQWICCSFSCFCCLLLHRYTGMLCGRCDTNYTGLFNSPPVRYGGYLGSCVPCSNTHAIWAALIGLFFVLFLYNAFGICMQLYAPQKRQPNLPIPQHLYRAQVGAPVYRCNCYVTVVEKLCMWRGKKLPLRTKWAFWQHAQISTTSQHLCCTPRSTVYEEFLHATHPLLAERQH